MIQWLNDGGLHDEDGPAAGVRILPWVPVQHNDLRDPPVHGHQGPHGLTRQRQNLFQAVTNNAELIYQGKFFLSSIV